MMWTLYIASPHSPCIFWRSKVNCFLVCGINLGARRRIVSPSFLNDSEDLVFPFSFFTLNP